MASGRGRFRSSGSMGGEGSSAIAGEIAPSGYGGRAHRSAGKGSTRAEAAAAGWPPAAGNRSGRSRGRVLGRGRLGDAGFKTIAEAPDAAQERSAVLHFDLLTQAQD